MGKEKFGVLFFFFHKTFQELVKQMSKQTNKNHFIVCQRKK